MIWHLAGANAQSMYIIINHLRRLILNRNDFKKVRIIKIDYCSGMNRPRSDAEWYFHKDPEEVISFKEIKSELKGDTSMRQGRRRHRSTETIKTHFRGWANRSFQVSFLFIRKEGASKKLTTSNLQ